MNNVNQNRPKLGRLIEDEKELYSLVRATGSELENARSSIRQNQNRGRQLGALLKERDVGNIPGIIGRLGDLGTINERFDVAISTACPQLDYIIVDNMDTAKQCVQLLKQRSLGLATFLGLDKMKDHLRNSQRPMEP